GVQLQFGEVAAHQVIDAEVLDDEGVDADVGQGGDGLDEFGQLVLADERVDGDEHTAARLQAVRVGGDLVHLIEREVFGLRAGRKLLQAEVDSVRTEVERRERRLRTAGRGQ